MAVPLIAAGAKVAGKAVAKKVLAKKAATLAAKQAGKQAAKKGIQKISTKAVKGKVGNLRKTSKEVNKAINLKDQVSDEGEKVKRKRDLLDRFLKKEKNVSAPEGEKTSKLVFNSALFCAIIKDVIEIYLTIYVSSWLIIIISFFPSAILAALLFFSGKKSTMKIVIYLLGIAVDYIVPGVNALPIATIAVIITFKLDDISLSFLKNLKGRDVKRGLGLVKKFVR
jgi:hypothetical protein